MSGNTVPSTNIYLKTALSGSNGIFEVFGTPTNKNLIGLRGVVYNTIARPPPVTPLSFPASGNLSMTTFGGKSAFLASPTVTVSNITLSSITPTLSNGTSYNVAVGTSVGDTSTTGGWVSATSGTAITTKADDTTSLAFTQGSSYYISTYSSNITNITSSLQVQNPSAYGIANVPDSATLTLTNLSSWSISWTAPSSGIAPTSYQGGLYRDSYGWVSLAGNIISPLSGTNTLLQDTNYSAVIYSIRPEGNNSAKSSSSVNLPSPVAPTGVDVSAMVVGAANVATYTPVVTGGGSGTKYVGISTTVGGITPNTSWSSGPVTSPIALAVGEVYYVSAMISNTTTGTVSSFINKKVLSPLAPVFSTNSISNTTFTAVASNPSSANGSTLSYTISPSANVVQNGGTFTSLTSNTQYTVTATASYGPFSSSTASVAVYCLSLPTFGSFTAWSTSYCAINTSVNSTGSIVSNINGASFTYTSRSSSLAWTRSSVTDAQHFTSNTLVSYSLATTASNSVYYADKILNFIVLDAGETKSITLPAATFTYRLEAGAGGTGAASGTAGGYGSVMAGSSTLTAGATLAMYAGRNGSNGSGTANTGTVNSGDGTKGGNGGYGAGTTGYGSAAGGSSGGGGSASQIMCLASNYIACAGGGGGGGGGGTQGGKGGGGGLTFSSAIAGAIGGQGESYRGVSYDSINGGGYYGGYGGAIGSGGSSGSALNGNYVAGSDGSETGFPLSTLSTATGKGGNGAFYFGTMGAGGGGGWGGGGAGVARNYNGSFDSGGGGGGGSYASDGAVGSAGFTSTSDVPIISIVCLS